MDTLRVARNKNVDCNFTIFFPFYNILMLKFRSRRQKVQKERKKES
jgi:hypothetical protein